MVKTKGQVLLETTGAIYTVLNLKVPYNVEGIERAMNLAQYVFARKPEKKISDENAKSQLDEFSTHAKSHLLLTDAENVQRIKEGKEPQ